MNEVTLLYTESTYTDYNFSFIQPTVLECHLSISLERTRSGELAKQITVHLVTCIWTCVQDLVRSSKPIF